MAVRAEVAVRATAEALAVADLAAAVWEVVMAAARRRCTTTGRQSAAAKEAEAMVVAVTVVATFALT